MEKKTLKFNLNLTFLTPHHNRGYFKAVCLSHAGKLMQSN